MKRQKSSEECVFGQFDNFCKKILRNEARDFYREVARRKSREKFFYDLSPTDHVQLSIVDDYFSYEHIFRILELPVVVKGNELAEALRFLPEQKRDIILLYYFLGKSDEEIAEHFKMVRRTVSRQRHNKLKQIRKYINGRRRNDGV